VTVVSGCPSVISRWSLAQARELSERARDGCKWGQESVTAKFERARGTRKVRRAEGWGTGRGVTVAVAVHHTGPRAQGIVGKRCGSKLSGLD
jgi:hypothetical protein